MLRNYKTTLLTVFFFVAVSLGALLFSGGNQAKQATPQTDAQTESNDSNQEQNEISVVNNIQNNISTSSNGEVTVDTTVQNNVYSESPISIENLITNNINGNGQANLSNNIENILSGNVQGILGNQINNNLNSEGISDVTNNLTNEFGDDTAIEVNNGINNSADSPNNNGNGNNGNDQGENNGDQGNIPDNLPEIIWGIDSASETTADFYGCVTENFGDPVVFGRYLGDREGVSAGLTTEQVNLIHDEGDYILPIYNHFNNATGFENGVAEAEEAIRYAEELGIPNEVALFADIEPNYPVDSSFIRGWYETIVASGYKSGIYGVFDPERDLYAAYNAAVEENPDILENNIIWTASPNNGITTQENAPEFNPEAPEDSLAYGWQYGLDAESCNIDTNLFMREIVQSLWGPNQK